jgi:hypothetical protein
METKYDDKTTRKEIFRASNFSYLRPDIVVPKAVEADQQVKQLFTELKPRLKRSKHDQKEKWLWKVLCNVAAAIKTDSYILAYSRQGTKEYPSILLDVIDTLTSANYLHRVDGVKNLQRGTHKSRVVVAEKLEEFIGQKLELFEPDVPPETKCFNREGESIEAPDLPVLKQINEVNFDNPSKLRYLKHCKPTKNRPDQYYQWMPLDKPFYHQTDCGRFCGAHHQQLTRKERKTILHMPSNQFLIELDVNGTHLRIIYNALADLPLDSDPYDILDNQDPSVRALAKLGVMTLINCAAGKKNRYSGVYRAFRHALNVESKYDNVRRCTVPKSAKEAAEAAELNQYYQAAGLDVKEIIELLEQRHKQVKQYFCQKIVHELFRIESNFCRDVMNYFAAREQMILAIHDGFMMVPDLEELGRKVISDCWARHNNGFAPRITRK